jgi:hypothetical protein
MENDEKQVPPEEITSRKPSLPRKPFVTPHLETHERLPEITGFSF